MLWHRLLADSLHLAVSRSQRGRMEYFNGLLVVAGVDGDGGGTEDAALEEELTGFKELIE